MKKWERKCKELCRELVMKTFCEKCGNSDKKLDQHHGLLKSSQRYKLNPFFWYDPTLQFCLCCAPCHLCGPESPHVNAKMFMAVMSVQTPDKAHRLREVNSGPLPPVIDARFVDWKMVYENLVKHGRPVGNEILAGC